MELLIEFSFSFFLKGLFKQSIQWQPIQNFPFAKHSQYFLIHFVFVQVQQFFSLKLKFLFIEISLIDFIFLIFILLKLSSIPILRGGTIIGNWVKSSEIVLAIWVVVDNDEN